MSPTWIMTAMTTTTTPMTTNSEKGHLTERPTDLAAGQPAGRPSALPRREQDILDEVWMRLAIAEAAHTAPGDVPVGAVVVDAEGRVVGRGSNRREADGDPLAHAEVIALREATRAVGDGWRLEQCTLVVTLEPCVMCAGACVMGRVGRVVFGAWSAQNRSVRLYRRCHPRSRPRIHATGARGCACRRMLRLPAGILRKATAVG